jgi:hypothetical protein
MADQHTPVQPVQVGEAIRVVDENYVTHAGLVTAVHGEFGQTYDTVDGGTRDYVPCLNVVYISADSAKKDPYGRQVERMSSLQHYSQGPNGMPTSGRYWENL